MLSATGSGPWAAAAGGRASSASATWPASRWVPQLQPGIFFDGRPSVGLTVYQLPGTNALDVADRIRDRMKELKQRFPEGSTTRSATTPRRSSASRSPTSSTTLFDAVVLVGLVVLFFLQDWRAMILPMIDVPVSLIGTFAVMAALGYSLNNISLFGLVLAIGIVVDDAIVVLENIERQMAKGLDARTATHQGDGGDHRADPRHHAGALCRVRAVRLHQRHHRAVLSASSR